MKRPAWWALVEKSRAACVAAVETYNRASSAYREETFAILMINAWELLLKARIMKENGGKRQCLYEYEAKKKKNGQTGARQVLKRNRTGHPLTINLTRAANLCSGYAQDRADEACIENINALCEIRDVATHFVARSALLTKRLSEISLASVKNYVLASQKWFKVKYSDLNIASIPISFNLDQMEVEAVAKRTPGEVTKFLAHLAKTEASLGAVASEYAFSVRVEFDLVKKKTDGAVKAVVVGAGEVADIIIGVDEDKVPAAYVWTYDELCGRLKARYSDFKANAAFHTTRKPLEVSKAFCYTRRLNPANKKSPATKFYNPNIVKEFDKHYTLKATAKAAA